MISSQQPNKKGFQGFINSPWLLITIPLLAAATWLAANTWIVTDNLNKPYALLAGPVLAASVLAVWLVIKFFNVIAAMFKAFGRARQENGTALFFWSTIVVFMAVSVLESGEFFNIFAGAVPGLGYATALVVDLVAVNLMQARLEAVRMADKLGSWLYLAGVALCAGLSAYANLHSALNNFNRVATGELPATMNNAAPWLACVFPAMILLMSIVADYSLDRTSTKLDANKYREQETKRLDVLRVRRDMERDRLLIDRDLAQIALDRKGVNHRDREFFLAAWLFPKKPADVQQVVDQVKPVLLQELEAVKNAFVQGLDTATKQSATLEVELEAMKTREVDYTALAQHVVPLITPALEEQMGSFFSEVQSMIVAPLAQEEALVAKLVDDSTENLTENSTMNLSENSTEQSRDTEEISVLNERTRKKSKTKRMQTILRRNPDISPIDLAAKADVSVSYAYRVKTTFLKNLQTEKNTAESNGHDQSKDTVNLGEYAPVS